MLLVGAILESYRSLKDKTIKLTFETQEPTPEQLISIAKHNQKFGFLAFNEDAFKQTEKEQLSTLESGYEDTGKSKGQRLRSVLFVNWNQDNKGYKNFDEYYNFMMEQIINHYKSKLD